MRKKFFIVLLFSVLLWGCSIESESIINDGAEGVKENRKPTGASANDLLSDNVYKKMIVELAYVEGFEPTEEAKNNFKSFIEERTFKPNGVELYTKSIPATGKEVYTINDVVTIENQYRTYYNTQNTIAVWALFVNGKSSKDSDSSFVLGTAYYNTSFVIFEETIRELSNGTFEPERSLLESSVIHHEFGHILGLTNLGTPLQTDHEDADHPKHCNEESCLMYWAAETSHGIGNLFSSNQIPTLDSQCIADLQANGGR
ncbi:membrane metalloprotease [Tenacibaculum singaporense]|uniref:membrane metalloprotease n=1 Tax=Tenacibaculum singaporense TaxID=2358479 RepID=UPI000F65ADB4|nr:membrane metalloprotease [Tenacibaculum singaporense]RSC95565.1 membrane metalloprotease [Tenacibaculum singaporense]